jgi:hypothetical protein
VKVGELGKVTVDVLGCPLAQQLGSWWGGLTANVKVHQWGQNLEARLGVVKEESMALTKEQGLEFLTGVEKGGAWALTKVKALAKRMEMGTASGLALKREKGLARVMGEEWGVVLGSWWVKGLGPQWALELVMRLELHSAIVLEMG